MYRLTIKDILEATGGVLLCGDENTEIKDVCINSKEIKPGDLFVPIIGERVDAHRFIESALHTGAATLFLYHSRRQTASPIQQYRFAVMSGLPHLCEVRSR